MTHAFNEGFNSLYPVNAIMANNNAEGGNFVWRLGNLQVNAEGQLPEDIRSAVQQLLPSGGQGAAVPAMQPHAHTHSHQHTHQHAHQAATHVINMEGGGIPDSPPHFTTPLDSGPPSPRAAGQPLPSVGQIWKSMQGAVPFILLLLTKILYDHRLGILVFVGLFGTFYHANSSLKKQISLRDSGTWMEWCGSLAWIITFLSANVFFIYYIFDEQQLYKSLYLGIPNVDHLDVWNLFWIVTINDFIIKFATVIFKSVVAILPKQFLSSKKKGKYYLLFEMLSQCYRSIVPITPWIYFLQDDQHGGPWFSAILVVLYTICKGGHVYSKYKELRKAFIKFKVDVSYGLPASREQLEAADNCCPICQDKFTDPVMLSCKHIFCEDCVSLWFDRERTCPMCRANIVDSPMWRDGNTNANLQIY